MGLPLHDWLICPPLYAVPLAFASFMSVFSAENVTYETPSQVASIAFAFSFSAVCACVCV